MITVFCIGQAHGDIKTTLCGPRLKKDVNHSSTEIKRITAFLTSVSSDNNFLTATSWRFRDIQIALYTLPYEPPPHLSRNSRSWNLISYKQDIPWTYHTPITQIVTSITFLLSYKNMASTEHMMKSRQKQLYACRSNVQISSIRSDTLFLSSCI